MHMEVHSNSFTETKSDNVEGGSGSPNDGPQSISKIENRPLQNEPYKTPQAWRGGGRQQKTSKGSEEQNKTVGSLGNVLVEQSAIPGMV